MWWGAIAPPPPTSRQIANLSEIFILSEVRKCLSYSDKTAIISKFQTNQLAIFADNVTF